MEKIRLNQVLIVEGKYDAAKLSELVDGLILTTNGFSVFTDAEKQQLIVELGRRRGLLILTDSDAAGFRIRRFLNDIAQGLPVKNLYDCHASHWTYVQYRRHDLQSSQSH